MENSIKSNFSAKGIRDYKIVQRALAGDQKAYAELLGFYHDIIFFMLLKMIKDKDDADDLTIEAFGKAFKNLAQYNPAFAFSTWLFNIATNNCIDFIRKRKLSVSLDSTFQTMDGDEMPYEPKSDALNPEEKTIKKQEKQLMKSEVEKLQPLYRNLIELRYYQEKSYQEISKELDLPIGTIKGQLFRARGLLCNSFKEIHSRL